MDPWGILTQLGRGNRPLRRPALNAVKGYVKGDSERWNRAYRDFVAAFRLNLTLHLPSFAPFISFSSSSSRFVAALMSAADSSWVRHLRPPQPFLALGLGIGNLSSSNGRRAMSYLVLSRKDSCIFSAGQQHFMPCQLLDVSGERPVTACLRHSSADRWCSPASRGGEGLSELTVLSFSYERGATK
uniref:Uncharacterized protein n=1 Tax=Fagus sylvatica TaxID=28930 RepID=A0A2N9GAA6_FAGSY